jgi:hypothetical protein
MKKKYNIKLKNKNTCHIQSDRLYFRNKYQQQQKIPKKKNYNQIKLINQIE